MKFNIYSIYDTATGLYSRPFYDMADAAAMRSFSDIATGTEHPISEHPEDYTLQRLGTFDDTTAKIHVEDRTCLIGALECVSNARNIVKDPKFSDMVDAQAKDYMGISSGGTA